MLPTINGKTCTMLDEINKRLCLMLGLESPEKQPL